MKKFSAIFAFGALFLFLFSCTKQSSMLTDSALSGFSKKANIQINNVHLNASTGGGFVPPAGSDLDTIETPTIRTATVQPLRA